jgi:hypothetical protein
MEASAWCVAISGLAKNTITAAMLIMPKAIVLCLFAIMYVLSKKYKNKNIGNH